MSYQIDSVLLLFPMDDGQTGPGFRRAFQRNEVAVEELNLDRASPEDIERVVSASDADLVWCARERVLAGLMPSLRTKSDAHRWCCYNTDVRNNIHEWEPLFPLFRRPQTSAYFTVGLGHIREWRGEGVNALWLPEGTIPELYHEPEKLTDADRARYTCDVSFIGGEYGMHEGRTQVLNILEQGPWEEKLWGCRACPEVRGEEHNKAAALSKINIAHSGWPQIDFYWSARAYQIMAAGGFVLANAHQGMAQWIPIHGPKRVLDYYQTADELCQKIDYWLARPEEREAVAERGRQWAMRNTLSRRVSDALNMLQSGPDFGDEDIFSPKYLSPVDAGDRKLFKEAAEAEIAASEAPAPEETTDLMSILSPGRKES